MYVYSILGIFLTRYMICKYLFPFCGLAFFFKTFFLKAFKQFYVQARLRGRYKGFTKILLPTQAQPPPDQQVHLS